MTLASTWIFADETVEPVLDPGRGRTKQGYFWAIARDDRPWGGGDPPVVVYNYVPGRGYAHANALLGGYRGSCGARVWSLQETHRASVRSAVHNSGFLLERCAPGLLCSGQNEGANRDRDAEAHR